MKMKRILAMLVCLVMCLSIVPAGILTAGADEGDGIWTTNRQADEYGDDVEIYRPEAGYHYDSQGFVTDTEGCYDNTCPFLNVQTKEPQNMKDGFFMEVRIDDFAYRGLDGIQDSWISFNIWTESTVAPFLVGYGEGWLTLLRSGGKGGAGAVERWFTTDEQGFYYNPDGGHGSPVTPRVDLRNREHWTFAVIWDEVIGYSIEVNGTRIEEGGALNDLLNGLNPDGMFYAGVCLHSTEWEGGADITITKTGTTEATATKPTGNDEKAAEANPNRSYECADPSTVPVNRPALLWNTDKESFLREPTKSATNLVFTPQGDKSYHVQSPGGYTAYTWTMRQDLSYDGYDFPLFAMMVKNLWCNAGNLYHCTGQLMFPNEGNKGVWLQHHSDTCYYTDEDENEYALVFLKLNMTGRINSIRVQFDQLDQSTDETKQFDIMFMGFFRNMEEAQAYADETYDYLLKEGETPPETEPETEPETDPATEPETEPETDPATEPETDPATEPETDPETDPATDPETKAPAASETEPETDEGCASTLGAGAAATVMTALAAAYALKKKE